MHLNQEFQPAFIDVVHSLPKVLLHDHLDGGLRPETIIELAEECGYDKLPSKNPAELQEWFFQAANSGSLPKYLETFAHTCAVMQTAPALERVAREAVEDLADDNVVYAELRFAPEQHLEGGLSLQEVVDAVTRGLYQGMVAMEQTHRVMVARLILCGMRHTDRTAEIAQLTVDNYRRRDSLVVGFDIAGAEEGFPPSKHAEAFQILRDNFVPFTIHAGEAAGLESLQSAVREGTLRIGHGARMFEDFKAAINGITPGPMSSYVLNQRIPLELCPTSNLQTGVVDDLADHPFELLRQMGFCCTVNTDNRLLGATTLTDEMMVLVDEFDYDLPLLFAITVSAMEKAFCDYDLRMELLTELIHPAYDRAFIKRFPEFADGLTEGGDQTRFAPDDDAPSFDMDEIGAGLEDLNLDLGMLEDLGINVKDLGIGFGPDGPGGLGGPDGPDTDGEDPKGNNKR